jgi:hypothetical protein
VWIKVAPILRACRIAKHHAEQWVSCLRPVWVRLTAGIAVVGVSCWLVYAGFAEWQASIRAPRQCAHAQQGWPQANFRYIQFNVESQELRAPVFDGGFFINLGKDYGTSPRKIKLTQSASTSGSVLYGATNYDAGLQWDQDTLWMIGVSLRFRSLRLYHNWAKDVKIGYREVRDHRRKARIPQCVQGAPLHHPGGWLLRVEEARRENQAALGHRNEGSQRVRLRGAMGALEGQGDWALPRTQAIAEAQPSMGSFWPGRKPSIL